MNESNAIKVRVEGEVDASLKQASDETIREIGRVTAATREANELRTRIAAERAAKEEDLARRWEATQARQRLALVEGAGSQKELNREAQAYVERLELQAATLGKSTVEQLALKASTLQLTDAQKQGVKQSLEQIQAHEKQQAMMKSLGAAARGAGALLGGFAAAQLAAAKASIEHAAKAQELAEKYGRSTEEMGAMIYQAKVADTSIEALSRSMDRLAVVQAAGNAGRGRQANVAFGILGIDAKDKDQKALLYEIADAFKAIDDAETKAALATMIFGQRGAEMVVYLSKGADELRRLEEEGRRWASVSGILGSQAKDLKDNMVTLQFASQELAKSLVTDLVPSLNAAIKGFLEARKEGKGFLASLGYGVAAAYSGDSGDERQRTYRELAEAVDKREAARSELDRLGVVGDDGVTRYRKEHLRRVAVLQKEITESNLMIGLSRNAIRTFEGSGAEKPPAPNKDQTRAGVLASQYRPRSEQKRAELEELESLRAHMSPEQYAQTRKGIEEKYKAGGRSESTADWIQSIEREAARKEYLGTSRVDEIAARLEEPGKKYSTADRARALAAAGRLDERALEKRRTQAYAREEADVMSAGEEYDSARARRQDEASAMQLDWMRQRRQMEISLVRDSRQRARETMEFEVQQQRERIDRLGLDTQERKNLEEQLAQWIARRQAQLSEEVKPAWRRMVEDWDDTTRLMRDGHERMVEATVRAGEDMVVQWRKTGQLSGKGMVDALLDEFTRTLYRKTIGKQVAGFADTLSSGLLKMLNVGTDHTGGIVGAESNRRLVDPAVFAGARRFHTGGIVGDEVPIVARRGEGVFTPEQMRALGSPRIQVNVVNQSGLPVQGEASAPRFDGETMVVDLFLARLERDGAVRARVASALTPPA